MARICGICPVSHLIASAKACDAILAVQHSATRRQPAPRPESGADHPVARAELLLSVLARPAARHGRRPGEAQHLRRGRSASRAGARRHRAAAVRPADHRVAGGQADSSGWVVPGGVNEPLTAEQRDQILAVIPEALASDPAHAGLVQARSRQLPRGDPQLRQFPHAVHGPGRRARPARALRRHAAHDRRRGQHRCGPARSRAATTDFIGEAVEPYTYMKFPYYKPLGYPDGIYRVGPLARLNHRQTAAARRSPTRNWAEFRELARGAGPQLVPLPLRAADRDPARHRDDRAAAVRPRQILDKHVRATAAVEQSRRHRRGRGAARHADPPLQGG